MRDYVKWFIVALAVSLAIAERASAASYLGLKMSDAPAAMGGGALVAAAAPNSPAMIAGLMPNDIVIDIDGQRIENSEQLVAAVAARNPGEGASLDVLRWDDQGWRRLAVRVTLAAAPSGAPRAPPPASVAAADPAPVAAAPIAVSGWTRLAEPTHQAFSIEIPQGWKLLAGVPDVRPTSPSFATWSPDGAILMIYNQVRLLGLHEFGRGGMPVFQPSQYVPAPWYIMGFGASLLDQQQCEQPQLQRLRLRNDIAQRIEAALPGQGQSLVADAMISCLRMGQPSLAYMAIGTRLWPPGPTMGTWQVDFEEIVIAPSDRIAAAIAIMSRSSSSIEWSQPYVEAAGQILSAQMQAEIRGLNQTLHESHLVDNIINGVGDFYNPRTNGTIQAPVGFDRYCQDAAGNVLGLNGGQTKPNCQLLMPVQ
jgi:hypothetical protein